MRRAPEKWSPSGLVPAPLYVSDSALPPDEARTVIAEPVEQAQLRNAYDNITGAPLITETDFAQFIEGPVSSIDGLVARLRADKRHPKIDVLKEEGCSGRRFEGWNLGYSGPEYILAQSHGRLFAAGPYPSRAHAAEDLIVLI